MTLALNNPPAMALQSSATIGTILPPLSPLPPIPPEAEVSEGKKNRNNRQLFELDADTDDVSFYDLYLSPCRGVLKASNDELLDHVDVNQMNDDTERNYIISYNNGGGNGDVDKDSDLYKAYYYYFDDIEYCGATFFGGCRFKALAQLQDAFDEPSSPQSFATFTVVYDYEMHYVQNTFGEVVGSDGDALSFSSEKAPKNVDPIPALQHLETIVVEHLAEVVGLSRRACDPSGRQSYVHDFSDEELGKMLAISSEPTDFLDPDHAECIVPVSSAIGESADCMPVTGGIRIYLNTTDIPDEASSSLADLELSIQSGFQRLIRFGMQQDLYVSGEDDEKDEEVLVKYVTFIGTRIVSGEVEEGDVGSTSSSLPPNTETENSESSTVDRVDGGDQQINSSRRSSLLAVVGAAVGALVLAGIGAAIRFKSKNSNNPPAERLVDIEEQPQQQGTNDASLAEPLASGTD